MELISCLQLWFDFSRFINFLRPLIPELTSLEQTLAYHSSTSMSKKKTYL